MTALRIVTHNAFWFQGAPFAKDRPGQPAPAVLASLAELYRGLRPDVLAIQEVQDARSFDLLAEALPLPGRYCPGGELAQYGGAVFFPSGDYVADWRCSPLRPQRMWQVVQVAAGEAPAIQICNIHLPSSRQLDPAAAGPRRIEELCVALGQLRPPAVVVGDFNEPPGGPVGKHLGERGFLDAAELAGLGEKATALGGGRGDQVWIHNTLRDRLLEYAAVDRAALKAGGGEKEYLSDHVPLCVTLRS